ncbi:hypothetical protein [Klenkia brasiliensis]|uniref:Transcriptional regulator, AbiEi antitoxin, Type IV TA system n=1 Tax=Klenkia brasiliensis TaxID=333142 RepID=A0A1G7TC26_9ACTN|nr:hypothetical protein [Klenkia brasiliensis]SDG32594.1 hypothetical protein SAMN05660324_2397 [Klenkia brasiliensis]
MTEFPGTYTWSGARAAGLTRRQIEADGVRLGRGVYLSRAEDDDLRTRCRAWAEVLPDGAAFALGTAAHLLGAPVDAPEVVHAVVPPDRLVPHRRGLVVLHRDLRPEDVVDLGGLPVTSGAQTFLDMARCTRPDELVAVGDALYRLDHLDPDRVQARLERADGLRGVVRARAAAPRLTPLAMSRPESLVRCWILDSPLPDPVPQMPVVNRFGVVVTHGDLGFEEWRMIMEYEGAGHATLEKLHTDVDRHSLAAADGYLVQRFSGRHLARPRLLLGRVESALRSLGWRPPPAAPC